MIVLLIFLLICSGLGIAAFIMSFTKKCRDGFKECKPRVECLSDDIHGYYAWVGRAFYEPYGILGPKSRYHKKHTYKGKKNYGYNLGITFPGVNFEGIKDNNPEIFNKPFTQNNPKFNFYFFC